MPGSAIFFSVYQGIRRQKVENKQLETLKNSFLAPAAGEIGACMIRVPVEVIKQRFVKINTCTVKTPSNRVLK